MFCRECNRLIFFIFLAYFSGPHAKRTYRHTAFFSGDFFPVQVVKVGIIEIGEILLEAGRAIFTQNLLDLCHVRLNERERNISVKI